MSDIDWFDNYRPTRSQMLPIWWRRLYFKGKTSWPFVSGDAFASLSMVHVNALPLSGSQRVRLISSKVNFVDSTHLINFLRSYEHEMADGSTLIIGNGDFDVSVVPEIALRKNLKIYAQNLLIPPNSSLFPIPAGIENIDYGRNGIPKYFKPTPADMIQKETILFGPFGDTHPSRREYLATALTMPKVFYVPPQRVEPKEYSVLARDFKFVFCPRGNGFDSHRFWETLYRGKYPIVENSIWAQNMAKLGIPMIVIEAFDQLNSELLSALHLRHPEPLNPQNYEALWMPFWEKMIFTDS